MASGKVHALANGVVIVATVALSTQLPSMVAIGAITGSVLGFVCTPDADIKNITYAERAVIKWIGPLGYLYAWFWQNYAQTHHHRGNSHKPFTGTLGRWWYAFKRLWWLLAIALYFYGSIILSHWFACLTVVYMAYLTNALQDIVHLVLDGWHYYPGR